MAWRNWLLRATAGDPSQMQIMYGAAGERRLDEWEIDWLPGYENSSPVRIGNAAAGQFQLDVYGEVMSALYESQPAGEPGDSPTWEFQLSLMDFMRDGWREPDDGIWEVRGPRRHFTHSKVMAWVAIDRAIKTAEEYGLEGPVDRWKEVRQEIHDQVCDLGFNVAKGSFTQYYGSDELDASLLMIPLVGFLPAHDPRVRGTIEAIERELVDGGFVLRYRTVDTGDVDGLTGREGAFLACSFWLADCLSMLGRDHDARQMLDRLLGLRNDLGLLAEEYDPVAGRLVGNFPQAFSHVSLVNSASKMSGHDKPTADHAILGLARRSLTRGKPGTQDRHMGGISARDMISTLAGRSGSGVPGGVARIIQSTVSPPPGAAGKQPDKTGTSTRKSRPTTKPSDKKPTALATKAPVKSTPAAKRRALAPAATKAAQKKAAATRTAAKSAKKAPAKKAPAKKAPAKKATPQKRPAKKAPAKKAPAKKAPAKKAPAKKATPQKRPAKKATTKKATTKRAVAPVEKAQGSVGARTSRRS